AVAFVGAQAISRGAHLTLVNNVLDTVAVDIRIASVTDTVLVHVGLVMVGHRRTVVGAIRDTVLVFVSNIVGGRRAVIAAAAITATTMGVATVDSHATHDEQRHQQYMFTTQHDRAPHFSDTRKSTRRFM